MFAVIFICVLLISSCLNPALAQVQQETELTFIVAQWAYEVRDEGDYDPNPSGLFPRGERAYAYFELEGFDVSEKDGLFYVQLTVDVALKTKNGLRLFSHKDLLDLESLYLEPPETFWFYVFVDIPWWAPRGVYQAEITVQDIIKQELLVEKREISVY